MMSDLEDRKGKAMDSYLEYSKHPEVLDKEPEPVKNPIVTSWNTPTLTLESEFAFGKHKGQQVEDIIEDFPGYISWLISASVAEFDEEAMELITKKGIV